jgi:hypothetical protein
MKQAAGCLFTCSSVGFYEGVDGKANDCARERLIRQRIRAWFILKVGRYVMVWFLTRPMTGDSDSFIHKLEFALVAFGRRSEP